MSLSNKIVEGEIISFIETNDVKTFIKKLKEDLKEDLCGKGFITLSEECFKRDIINKIDKLAGKSLVEKENEE